MASAAQSAIWRAGTTTGAGTEPTTQNGTEDIIEFNNGAVVNNNGVLISTKFSMTSAVAVNEMPSSIDKLQDTGVNGIIVYITGSIEHPKTDGLDPAQKFKTWMNSEGTTVNLIEFANELNPDVTLASLDLTVLEIPVCLKATLGLASPSLPPVRTALNER